LFNLGIAHLPLLAQLRTLHLYAVPPVAYRELNGFWRRSHHISDERGDPPRAKATRAVLPKQSNCAEYLAVWTRYNEALRSMKFVEGAEWVREWTGGMWSVQNVE
jgi:hypothetical protein